jgi:hypothetical protein
VPAGPVGSVWASGSWSNTSWEEDTWADAAISTGACPIGSVWASGSWSDTSWFCDTWADATGAVISPGDEVMVIIEGGILCRVFKHDDPGSIPVRVVIESPKRITVLTEGGSAIKVIM